MTIELIVVETLERKLADVPVPRVDVTSVRRAGRRHRLRRIGSAAAAVLIVIGAVTALLVGATRDDPVAERADVPAMDFAPGLRGFYDPGEGKTLLGQQSFDLDAERGPGTGEAATPYGLVFFGPDQTVRLLPADGRVRTLAASPARRDAFLPTVKYDPSRGLVAWLTKGRGRVTLSVYEFGAGPRLLGSYPVPCSGEVCESLEVAGVDQGLVFVRGDSGSRFLDPAAGPEAGWTTLTDGWVTDVRNRVILSWQDEPGAPPSVLADQGWRLAPAQRPDSLLTFDGAYELSGSTTLAPTTPDAVALPLVLPAGEGSTRVGLDSDGSVLVARYEAGADVYWDCPLGAPCLELTRLPAEAPDWELLDGNG